MAFDTHNTTVYERVQPAVNTVQHGISLLGFMPVQYENLFNIHLFGVADYLNIYDENILDSDVLDIPIECQWYVTLF